MLFKHKHLLKELRKSGRRATAEIISVKTVGEGRSIRALWAPDEDLSSGWIDCTANGSTIAHTAPYAVHCVLPGVDAHLDTLTVSAAR